MVRCSVTKPTTYQPIASLEAEQLVLGAILVRPEVMDQVAITIQPDDFYRKAHAISSRPFWTCTLKVNP